MRTRVLMLTASIALVTAAGASATGAKGTLTGVVMRGPVVPVCAAEQPCDEPAAKVTLLFVRAARVVGRDVTDERGRYWLRLPAGLYTVRRATVAVVDRKLSPKEARVRAGRVNRVDFFIDTGIR